MKERHVPINEAGSHSERVHVNIPFPSWIDEEEIGIDVERLEKFLDMGGISHAVIRAAAGETESTSMVPVGVAPDGTAYSGGLGVQTKAPLFHHTQESKNDRSPIRNAVWADVDIHLHQEEIKNRILDEEGSVRDPESWVPHLDQAIRDAIRTAGTDHLLRDFSLLHKAFAALINIDSGLLNAADMAPLSDGLFGDLDPHIPTIEELVSVYMFNFVAWNIMETVWSGRNKNGKGHRISLFPGYEIDRALLLQIATRTMPLVESIDDAPDENI